jgi:dephospho-CoA kinase
MTIVGLTGSIGSGKSAAAHCFQALGAEIIDADLLAREVVAPETSGWKEIYAAFGSEFFSPDGDLNRKKLAQLVFNDPENKLKLEAIIHPKIRDRFTLRLKELREQKPDTLIIAVIPLLFETGNQYAELEKIICIVADEEICIRRIMSRDNCARAVAERKINSQLPQREKANRSDFVIENNGTLEDLQLAVQAIYRTIIQNHG